MFDENVNIETVYIDQHGFSWKVKDPEQCHILIV